MRSKNKESQPSTRKKDSNGHRPIRSVCCKRASESEASQIEQALDRLLIEMIRQERARERSSP